MPGLRAQHTQKDGELPVAVPTVAAAPAAEAAAAVAAETAHSSGRECFWLPAKIAVTWL